jgi:hypothetical protein
MAIEFEFARWFTNEDYQKLNSIIQHNKIENNSQNQLSWLQSNSDAIIKMHSDYCSIEWHDQWEKRKQNSIDVRNHNLKINNIKNGDIEYCICGSELKFVTNYNFVGCSNYLDKTQKHTIMYYKQPWYEDDSEPFSATFKLHYLSDICKKIKQQYNIKIQSSNLFEFYLLNNVELLNKNITRETFKNAVQASETSKKREILIKSILEKNNIRFGYQRKIIYKIKDGKQSHAIPDFIAFINDKFYIIEQKKNMHNINEYQVDFYKDLISFMYPNKKIHIIFIIEESSDDIEYLMRLSERKKNEVLTVEEFKKFISWI